MITILYKLTSFVCGLCRDNFLINQKVQRQRGIYHDRNPDQICLNSDQVVQAAAAKLTCSHCHHAPLHDAIQ
jgi:hypothetical protein